MAENVTTVLDMNDAEDISAGDHLYLIQGSGSGRDRKVSLAALFASDPAHTLTVDELDGKPSRHLLDKFDTNVYSVPGDTEGKVRFYATYGFKDTIGRIIRAEPKNLDGSEFNKDEISFRAGVLNFGKEDDAGSVQNFEGTSKFYVVKIDQTLDVKNGKITAGGGIEVPDRENEGETLFSVDRDNGDIQTKGDVTANAVNALTVTGSILQGSQVKTNYLTADDPLKPLNVQAAAGYNVNGNTAVKGAFSADSATVKALGYESTDLNSSGVKAAPAFPFYTDQSSLTNLTTMMAGANPGARIAFINKSGGSKKYTFNDGATAGWFTLRNGRAVDLLVTMKMSETQVGIVPLGVDFSTADEVG